MRLSNFALVATLSLVIGGCGIFGSTGGGTGSSNFGNNEYVAAKKAGDVQTLSDACRLKLKPATSSVRSKSCRTAMDILIANNDLKTLGDICNLKGKGEAYEKWTYRETACAKVRKDAGAKDLEALEAADCGGMIAAWETARKALAAEASANKGQSKERFARLGKKMAKCGHWDFLVEKVTHWGSNESGMGYAAIKAIGDDGADWEQQFFAYVKRKGDGPLFEGKPGVYFLGHYVDYLKNHGKMAKCNTDYIPVADRVGDTSFGPFSWYFRTTKCKKAAKIVAKRLKSDRHQNRIGACKTLGVIGSKRKHRKSLANLGKTDPYFWLKKKDRDGNLLITPIKMYDVRTVCMQAANKL